MNFVYMKQTELDEGHWFPNEEGVIPHQEARGWVVTDPPEETPFVSAHGDIDPEQEWVTLWHPEIQTTHEFPNNPAALEGAYESGWTSIPKPESEEPEAAEVSEDSSAKKKPAKKATASASADDKEKVKE